MALSATFFLYFLVLVSAEYPITEIPEYLGVLSCAQDCIRAVSSTYSSILECPESNPAACLCSLGPETILQSAVEYCYKSSCTVTATWGATGSNLETPYMLNSAETVIASYCQVNGYTTPTVPPNSITLVAASALSPLQTAQATGTGSVGLSASAFPVTSNVVFTTIIVTSLTPYPTSQGNSNSTSQPTGDTSPGLSSATIGGIVAAVLVSCVIICVMLWLRNLRQRFPFSTYVNRVRAGHRREPLQEKRRDSSSTVSELRPNNLSSITLRPSSILNEDPAHLFQPEDVQDQGIPVPSSQERVAKSFSLSASPPQGNSSSEKIDWRQNILLYSVRRDKRVDAVALLDTGASENWIHPLIVAKNGFLTEPADPRTYTGAHGDSFTPTRRVHISWESAKYRKFRQTWFLVASKESPYDVILGQPFIDSERMFRHNVDPHAFNKETRAALRLSDASLGGTVADV